MQVDVPTHFSPRDRPQMSSKFEKSVKGGTKVKLAPPKSKYVEHILIATQSGEAAVAEVFRTLTHRLRDATWTVAFKSLIIVHLMIKEGAPDVTLAYLSAAPTHRLAINSFTDVQTQGHNIRCYSEYLLSRAKAFAASKTDYVARGQSHMKMLAVDKGLLRETEIVQDQVRHLVKCDLLNEDENEISLTAFRLVTRDLLDLYNAENEGMMNVLSHYFEMSKTDAERSIRIYKTFCKQTDQVVQFLSVARQFEQLTRLEIPKIKHAPTSLAKSLQEYLDDKDFDMHRRQYVAEQQAKQSGKPFSKPAAQPKSQPTVERSAALSASAAPTASSAAPVKQAKGPAPDLIDFFDSIEQHQQPMAQSVQQVPPQQTDFAAPQQTGFIPQQQQQQPFGQPQNMSMNGFASSPPGANPFAQPQIQQQQQPQPQQQYQPMQPQATGAGFGGYGPQTQQSFVTGGAFVQEPSQSFGSPVSPIAAQPVQPQSTNPFRQSSMPIGAATANFGQSEPVPSALQRQNTNPFARQPQAYTPPLPAQQSIPEASALQSFSPQPIAPQQTGTNPFARPQPPQQQQGVVSPLSAQPTGTNPFRQSAFVNQGTGQGWQSQPGQATMGGLEQMETVRVFPRPGQAQSQGQSPWG
nr:hypothetical protein B0A51_03708 [Rachicladosporium sp. CCFEE 5018]